MKIAKNLLHQASYPLFLRTYYLKYRVFELRRDEYCRRKLGIHPFVDLDLNTVKRSDTLFILGSGSSINQISPERWKVISQHDSVGFNFWPIHSFVPSMYFVETIQTNPPHDMFEPFCSVARRRAKDYASVPKVVTELRNAFPEARFAGWEEFPGPWYALRTLPVAANTEAEFAYGLTYLRRKGLFKQDGRIQAVFKQASTLSCLIALAIRMQYRIVVLCGMDLKDSRYFYQDPQLYPETASLEFSSRTGRHATNSVMPWRITIESVILEMRRQLLDPAGIALYVENRSSALWPRIEEVPNTVFSSNLATVRAR
jgi:hypothetical protein